MSAAQACFQSVPQECQVKRIAQALEKWPRCPSKSVLKCHARDWLLVFAAKTLMLACFGFNRALRPTCELCVEVLSSLAKTRANTSSPKHGWWPWCGVWLKKCNSLDEKVTMQEWTASKNKANMQWASSCWLREHRTGVDGSNENPMNDNDGAHQLICCMWWNCESSNCTCELCEQSRAQVG